MAMLLWRVVSHFSQGQIEVFESAEGWEEKKEPDKFP